MAYKFAIEVFLFVKNAEFIARARIKDKVDHATEDVGHLHDRCSGNLFALPGKE